MTKIGTPLSKNAKKALLLGSGELGKEVTIELQRFGVEVIAVDRYQNAPAMQVAHRSHVIDMLDRQKLREIIKLETPDLIIPEIEAIATAELLELENEGYCVIPSANAASLTMNRKGIRILAAETLKLPTSNYRFVETYAQLNQAITLIGYPCVIKPIMSSSGKGQSLIKNEQEIQKAWDYSQSGGRTGKGEVIVEGFIDFDYEITLLTIQHRDGVSFCEPIGHVQVDGDYRESWQPQNMSPKALERSKEIAKIITEALGGRGLFGVELFIKGEDVWFSEVSPRPHDTGLVTLISQDLSEFALHARAILGLPIPNINLIGPSASKAILVEGETNELCFGNLEQALIEPDTALKLFGKPTVNGRRRMGVTLARGKDTDDARKKALTVHQKITVENATKLN